jgi:hypothetical protein
MQFAAIAWSADVLLYYIATFSSPGLTSFWFVVGATVVGFASLLLPHLAFHLPLRRMQARLSARIRVEAEAALASQASAISERVRILAVLASDPPITWTYDLRVIFPFTLGPLISAAVGFLGQR